MKFLMLCVWLILLHVDALHIWLEMGCKSAWQHASTWLQSKLTDVSRIQVEGTLNSVTQTRWVTTHLNAFSAKQTQAREHRNREQMLLVGSLLHPSLRLVKRRSSRSPSSSEACPWHDTWQRLLPPWGALPHASPPPSLASLLLLCGPWRSCSLFSPSFLPSCSQDFAAHTFWINCHTSWRCRASTESNTQNTKERRYTSIFCSCDCRDAFFEFSHEVIDDFFFWALFRHSNDVD